MKEILKKFMATLLHLSEESYTDGCYFGTKVFYKKQNKVVFLTEAIKMELQDLHERPEIQELFSSEMFDSSNKKNDLWKIYHFKIKMPFETRKEILEIPFYEKNFQDAKQKLSRLYSDCEIISCNGIALNNENDPYPLNKIEQIAEIYSY